MTIPAQSRTRSISPTRSKQAYSRSASWNVRRNPMMFMTRNPAEIGSRFVMCSEPGCVTSSGVADFNSMTIRTGLSRCTRHVSMTEVKSKFEHAVEFEGMTLIFYDIELSRDGEIEQIGACTESGQSFSAFVKTSVRTNSSPFLRKIGAEYWLALAEEPRVTFKRFIDWTSSQHSQNPNSNGKTNGIMLAAHYGSCHDHVHILRTMMKWGITPPDYLLVDTLAIFKTVKSMNENAKLHTLVNKYVPWFDHVPHDADSDAEALRFVTMVVFPNTKMACYAFSISCTDFMTRTGLNMYVPSPIAVDLVPCDDTIMQTYRILRKNDVGSTVVYTHSNKIANMCVSVLRHGNPIVNLVTNVDTIEKQSEITTLVARMNAVTEAVSCSDPDEFTVRVTPAIRDRGMDGMKIGTVVQHASYVSRLRWFKNMIRPMNLNGMCYDCMIAIEIARSIMKLIADRTGVELEIEADDPLRNFKAHVGTDGLTNPHDF